MVNRKKLWLNLANVSSHFTPQTRAPFHERPGKLSARDCKKNAVAIRTAPVRRLVFPIRTGVTRFH